jgi:hypothetical protein
MTPPTHEENTMIGRIVLSLSVVLLFVVVPNFQSVALHPALVQAAELVQKKVIPQATYDKIKEQIVAKEK